MRVPTKSERDVSVSPAAGRLRPRETGSRIRFSAQEQAGEEDHEHDGMGD
jgi:hypothetical protein